MAAGRAYFSKQEQQVGKETAKQPHTVKGGMHTSALHCMLATQAEHAQQTADLEGAALALFG